MRKLFSAYTQFIGEEDRPNPCRNLAFKDDSKGEVPPFKDEWVRTRILKPDALASMNEQARLIVYEQLRAEHLRNIEIQQANRMRAEASIGRIDAELRSLRAGFGRTAVTDLAEAKTQATMASEEVRKSESMRQFQETRAPVDGVVQQLSVTTVGGVVQPAQPLMVIVPCSSGDASDLASCNSGISVEAFVQNKDIGFVKVGQRVAVKLEAFSFTDYGLIEGAVENISRDAIDQSDAPAGRARDENGRPIQPGLSTPPRARLPAGRTIRRRIRCATGSSRACRRRPRSRPDSARSSST